MHRPIRPFFIPSSDVSRYGLVAAKIPAAVLRPINRGEWDDIIGCS